ncbi:MAG: Cof-type HAD-IIB family hydrolase [Oscillospiraceae bacterium]|nr:Cof-type HAD-IIB family hydrolase [Oscillospiraceae bacterium]
MKLIFLDIDGTLVSEKNGAAPPSAAAAVRAARALGSRVYLTTGRSKAEIYADLWEIGFDGLIGGNGLYVEDGGAVALDLALSAGDTARAVDWLKAQGLGFYLESKNGLFGSDTFLKASAKQMHIPAAFVKKAFPKMIFGENLYRDDVAKISFCLTKDVMDAARRAFGETLKVDTWGIGGKPDLFGEFSLPGADKVHAVRFLLDRIGGRIEDTFAFGDARSDLEMIRFCGTGVAMGNACDALKEAADLVTDTVENDGLAKAFAVLHLT